MCQAICQAVWMLFSIQLINYQDISLKIGFSQIKYIKVCSPLRNIISIRLEKLYDPFDLFT